MTEQTNVALREYVTNVGFQLTLSKLMIDMLVALDHFKGFTPEFSKHFDNKLPHFVSTGKALAERGLIYYTYPGAGKKAPKNQLTLTKAGRLTLSLLKEAGLYQERVKEMGLQ